VCKANSTKSPVSSAIPELIFQITFLAKVLTYQENYKQHLDNTIYRPLIEYLTNELFQKNNAA
jgi:hypothetical protein